MLISILILIDIKPKSWVMDHLGMSNLHLFRLDGRVIYQSFKLYQYDMKKAVNYIDIIKYFSL